MKNRLATWVCDKKLQHEVWVSQIPKSGTWEIKGYDTYPQELPQWVYAVMLSPKLPRNCGRDETYLLKKGCTDL
jgi:hypothetical protein